MDQSGSVRGQAKVDVITSGRGLANTPGDLEGETMDTSEERTQHIAADPYTPPPPAAGIRTVSAVMDDWGLDAAPRIATPALGDGTRPGPVANTAGLIPPVL